MGLVFTVGLDPDDADEEVYEWVADDIAASNAVLKFLGYSEYVTPASWVPPREEFQLVSGGVPYDWLHELRAVYARVHALAGENDQDAITRLTKTSASHLLDHADNEDMYLPVDFEHPLTVPDIRAVVGSSQRLVAELISVSPALGMQIDSDGRIAAASLDSLVDNPDSVPLGGARECWAQLYDSARVSVSSGLPLIFQ